MFFTPPVTNRLLYSTLLCKKIARAPGGGGKIITSLGGGEQNRSRKSVEHIHCRQSSFLLKNTVALVENRTCSNWLDTVCPKFCWLWTKKVNEHLTEKEIFPKSTIYLRSTGMKSVWTKIKSDLSTRTVKINKISRYGKKTLDSKIKFGPILKIKT